MENRVELYMNHSVPFNNKVDFCVGTGRMGLALQKEYYEQLKLVQEKIEFKYIRGHGLFSDDMAIYQEYKDEDGNAYAEYNFTYLDFVIDSYLELRIKPYLELGFMPEKLSSGNQTVFYWRGNVTPPKSYQAWADLIKATLTHMISRYGLEEVLSWPIEVWNEPNLPGFWKDADREEYFKLFLVSFEAVKEVDSRLRVGGPAICGVNDEEWIREFMKFCQENEIAVDFITRHHYTTELPERKGHYSYQELTDPEYGKDNLHKTREIVDSFIDYRGLEIHITEFNTSYVPNNPLHDTNQNAAFIAHQLSWLGDDNYSYSYWTFGDVFEEGGVPFTPFHGGFGLVANHLIPKPTFWTFQFFKQLQGECIYRSDEAVIIQQGERVVRGVVWNHNTKRTGKRVKVEYSIGGFLKEQEYGVIYKSVDETTCNPLKVWHDMGEPSALSKGQIEILREAAQPSITSERKLVKNETLQLSFDIAEFGVTYFEASPISGISDRGFKYKDI